jgi:hypothetical protein
MTTSDAAVQNSILTKIEDALRLLEEVHPRAYRAVKRHIGRVLVVWAPHYRGSWYGPLGLCELSLEYVTRDSPDEIASTLVHEAAHARLERLGFRYHESLRFRLEAVCTRKQIEFVEKLPHPEMLLKELHATLEWDPNYWSEANLRAARIGALRTLGAPRWLIAALDRIHRWRAA